jgi:hypothetical protein
MVLRRVPDLDDTAVRPAVGRRQRRLARGSIRRLPALLVAAAVLLSGGLSATSASARPLYTGMSGVYDYSPAGYKKVRATGAQFVRIGVPWGSIAPKQEPAQWQPEDPGDPNYDWGYVDGAVRFAENAGLTPVLMVNSVPTWAQGCQAPAVLPEASCDSSPVELAKFAVAEARRFSGEFGGLPRVKYWQGLNEPNLSLYFLPQYEGSKLASPYLYRRLINSFYTAIKSVSASNLVLSAGLGPIAVPLYTVGPMKFARELLCMKGGSNPKPKAGDCEGGLHFDIFDVHPYTTGGPTHEGGPNDVELGDLPKLTKLLRAADRAGRIHGKFKRTPLWATEFAWDSKPPDPTGLALKIETRWAAEALHVAWSAGVDHLFWYGLTDEPLARGQPSYVTSQSGLYFRDSTGGPGRRKQVFYAFRFPFVAYPQNGRLSVWGRTPSSGPGGVAIQLLRGGSWRILKTVRADSHGIFRAKIPSGYGQDLKGAVRARFQGTSSVPFSMRPVPDFRQSPFG